MMNSLEPKTWFCYKKMQGVCCFLNKNYFMFYCHCTDSDCQVYFLWWWWDGREMDNEVLCTNKKKKKTPTRLDTMQPRDEHSWILYRKNLHFINILNYKGRSTNTDLCMCVLIALSKQTVNNLILTISCFLTSKFPFYVKV